MTYWRCVGQQHNEMLSRQPAGATLLGISGWCKLSFLHLYVWESDGKWHSISAFSPGAREEGTQARWRSIVSSCRTMKLQLSRPFAAFRLRAACVMRHAPSAHAWSFWARGSIGSAGKRPGTGEIVLKVDDEHESYSGFRHPKVSFRWGPCNCENNLLGLLWLCHLYTLKPLYIYTL